MKLPFCVEGRSAAQDPSSIDRLDRLNAEVRRTLIGIVFRLEGGDLTLPIATVLLTHGHGRSLRSPLYLAAMRAISIFHSGRARDGTVTSVLATRRPFNAVSRSDITAASEGSSSTTT